MAVAVIPPGVIERIVEELDPEEVWLFGSRARETHDLDGDWDFMAILPDTAPDAKLDLAFVWTALRELRRIRVEVIPMRRRDFEEDRDTPGELAEAVAREGRLVYRLSGAAGSSRSTGRGGRPRRPPCLWTLRRQLERRCGRRCMLAGQGRRRADLTMSRERMLELLGLGGDADAAAIKRRYRELARRYHPDVDQRRAVGGERRAVSGGRSAAGGQRRAVSGERSAASGSAARGRG